MKNKIFLYISAISLALTLTACSNEEENIFDQSAAERLNSVSATYSGRLTNSKGGWVMEYYPYTDNEDPITGVGYLIMNRFNSDGSVYTMMKNKATGNAKWEDTSAWEVITDMGPVLSYNSWNRCYGRFTDPVDIDLTTGRSEDESGKGFQGDYEFVMVDVPEGGNHIMLKGKKRGVYERLTRLPEGTDFEAYLNDISDFWKTHFIENAQWELDIVNNGNSYKMNYADRGLATIYPEGKDSTAYGWHMPFLVTKYDNQYHLRFKEKVENNGAQMEQEYYFNTEDEVFHGLTNPSNTISASPINFFYKAFFERHRWKTTIATENSDYYKTLIQNLVTELASGTTKYEIDGTSDNEKAFKFRQEGEEIRLEFMLKFRIGGKTRTGELAFGYSWERTANGIKLNYIGSRSDGAQNFYDLFPSLQAFVNSFNGEFIVKGRDNSYSLRNMKFTSATDPNKWMMLQYEN